MDIEGITELPLHDGHVPPYLLRRMKFLGSLIARHIIETYGPEELLRRLANPYWFQAFNNVIGMDWDSSGSTTVVLYVLKEALPPDRIDENEIAVLGGKGRDAVNTALEIARLRIDLDKGELVRLSRVAAKIDSVALQDGYILYIHGLLVTSYGKTLVIQQGMNIREKLARRYHIYVENGIRNLLSEDPHSGVISSRISTALNLVDDQSCETRKAIVDILNSTPLDSLLQDLRNVNRLLKGLGDITLYHHGYSGVSGTETNKVVFVDKISGKINANKFFYRPITDMKRVELVARKLKETLVQDFKDLLLREGLGPETMRAIALVADLIYGYEPSFTDPTTHLVDPFLYAYAHGGKDGIPYKVRIRELDKTIEFFTNLINCIRVGNKEREYMLRNLSKIVLKFKYFLK
ncbi:MAG: DUF763 domain-containing protein [Desulfurococcaceae archaeon]